jgi:hypothetical protein
VIDVECVETPAGAADVQAALDAIDAQPGVWLGCDVAAPGLFRREAKAALEPLLAFYLDGALLRVVPHGDIGRALAEELRGLARFDEVQGRLETRFASTSGAPHPVITLLRSFLARFTATAGEFGLYGTSGWRTAKRCPTTAGAGWSCCCRAACCSAATPAIAGSTSISRS